MICMKKVRISSSPRVNVRQQRPPCTARVQSSFLGLLEGIVQPIENKTARLGYG